MPLAMFLREEHTTDSHDTMIPIMTDYFSSGMNKFKGVFT